MRLSLGIDQIGMFWLEICLYSGCGGTWLRAGLEDIIGQGNGDYSNDSDNEVGKELSLESVSNAEVVEAGQIYLFIV